MSALFTDLQGVRSQADKYTKLEEPFKQENQQAMDEASQAKFETESVSWKRSKDSTSVDTRRLLSASVN
ncbi:hypothetical protein [Pollutimonas thiosulfatoxidans]|uniref:Uncharacterized protein n=1 Tax=Pollutimonas thiosulfatoxidans TaxID=2028345 RepID=A0A410GAW8_9BURK|nr:hypothetical protein [Pollutimonas thiosulfatoxidans]QAA93435.1 hypothetical protein CKA81_06000 [Pollutimonas thiosulfatoxidans]